MCKQWHVSCKQPTHGAFFRVVNRLFSTTGSQLPLAPDVCTWNQKIVLKLFDHHLNWRSNSRESRWSFVNTPEIIIDSSGKGRKVWKSEVISPAVIVYSGSGSHVGSFRVDCTGSKQTNYTKICFIQKPNNTIRVLIGLCKFWGPWAHRVILNIVVYGIVL